MVAGRTTASSVFSRVSFDARLGRQPVVFASVGSTTNPDNANDRLRMADASGFDVALQERSANADSTHGAEVLHYVAIEPTLATVLSGPEIGRFATKVTDLAKTLFFARTHSNSGAFFSEVQTANDERAVTLRYSSFSGPSVVMLVDAENSNGVGPLQGGGETVGYAVWPLGALYGRPR